MRALPVLSCLVLAATAAAAQRADLLVYPDGRAFNLYNAMQRLRYREGYDQARLLEPGKVYPVEITGLVAGNYFARGHRIRIEVAGSNFPNFERNLQTGGNHFDETRPVVAVNRIHHATGKASFIELPTVPRWVRPGGDLALLAIIGLPPPSCPQRSCGHAELRIFLPSPQIMAMPVSVHRFTSTRSTPFLTTGTDTNCWTGSSW